MLKFLPPTDENTTPAFNPDNIQFAQSQDHTAQLLFKAAQLDFEYALRLAGLSFLDAPDHILALAFDQSVHMATQHATANPREQYNTNKAQGSNAEIDDALDYIHGTNGRLVDYEKAVDLLNYAADKGYAKAYSLLGHLHRQKKLPPSRQQMQLYCWIQAGVRGSPEGQYYTGFYCYAQGLYKAAADWFQRAANQNHHSALVHLALMYEHGFHFPKDMGKATKLLLKAANEGKVLSAHMELARLYIAGKGVKQSYSSAAEWLTKVANTPLPLDGTDDITKMPDELVTIRDAVNSANYNLGMMHFNGQHFPPSIPMTIHHLALAAEGGAVYCQTELGYLFSPDGTRGVAFPQRMHDDTAAVKWFTMAANNNDAYSQYRLGMHLYKGLGVKEDVVAAAEWWRKAIDNGSIEAASNLGMLHYYGEHPHLVPKDTKEGLRLLTSAAERGHLATQTQLAIIFEKLGNNVSAEKWHAAGADRSPQNKFELASFYIRTPEYLPPQTTEKQMTEKQLDLKILNLLSSAAKQGNLNAKFRLGQTFYHGFRSLKNDFKKSIQFFADCITSDSRAQEAPSEATLESCFMIGVIYQACEGFPLPIPTPRTSLGFVTPLEWFTFGANHGNAPCQCKIAEMYFEGKGGLNQDYALASYWVDKSFSQGNTEAAALVGKMQHRGVFVRPPESEEDE